MKRKKNVNLKDKKNIKLSFILSLFLVLVFLGMSVGFALYTQVINVSGTAAVDTQGDFGITNVVKTSSNNTSDAVPSWTEDTVDFHLTFVKNDNNPVYTANYDITLKNDTFFERLISNFNFEFSVLDSEDHPLGTIDYEIENYQDGEVMQPLTEKVITVKFTFTPTVEANEYDVTGGGEVESNEKPTGAISVNSMTPATGSVKGGALQQVTISINSSYTQDKVISISVASDKLELVNAGGAALGTFTVPASSENQTYTFYIKAKDDALFPEDTITAGLILSSAGLPNVSLGNITLDVDKHEEYVDTTPPIISNVVATMSNEVGVVNLTWNGTDDYSGIKSYTVLVCDNSGNVLKTLNAGTNTSLTVQDLSNGTTASTYNFKVYGTDNEDNTASSSDISGATTSSGYCSASGEASYQWVFSVTRNLRNISGSGANTVNIGETYTITLTANNNYSLPNSITVTMGGRTLTQDSGYTYSTNNGRVSIPNVDGNINITATGNWSCLVEGTKVLMANGKYKNVEDINYDDLMAVWSYNTGELVAEYPIWIERESSPKSYLQITFSDNTTLNTFGPHGIYNADLGMFVNTEDRETFNVGTTVLKVKNGKLQKVKVVDLRIIEKQVKVYHIISSYYFNIISDDVITTDRNLMISNQYGFTENLTWPDNIQYKIKNDPSHLYEYKDFKDIMPYYIFKGLRVDEGKYLVDLGLISGPELKMYLHLLPANPEYYREVETNKDGKRLWMITTSFDNVNDNNKDMYKKVEGSTYKLPNKWGVKCFRNSIDNKCYSPGSTIKVYSGMHFVAEYR